MKQGYTYIITNINHTVFYTGSTIDLSRRMYEHKERIYSRAFSAKYNCCKLVYYEFYESISEAAFRERQIKNLVRRKKISLIKKFNPKWVDLSDYI